MKLITNKINENLKQQIKLKFKTVENLIKENNNRINHINIFHRDWKTNDCQNLINIIKNDYNINTEKLISLGFITSQKNCHDQHFHIDYNGTTETYFIPLIDLTDCNGTEYVEFKNDDFNLEILDKLISINDTFILRNELEQELKKMGINKETYEIKILNSNKWGMVYMPNYLFHRGQSNKGGIDRTMFQIVLEVKPNAIVSNQIKINDSELDEENDVITKLLQSRSLHNN